MKKMKSLLSAVLSLAFITSAYAEKFKYENSNKGGSGQPPIVAANCTPATAATELDINNTRALIQSGGDMWWDFNRARYEIPKGSNKTSLFAGSLWLAGQDVSGQFKVAALRFRQVGNDYWTGPLSTINAEIDPATCRIYDRHWETTRSMVAEFSAWYEAGVFDQENGTTTQTDLYPGYSIPTVITEWPAHGRNFDPYNEDYYLAPFYDRDGDGDYDPEGSGDYPGYVLVGKSDCSRRVRDIYGDQNIWWVFNDKGNVHTESGGLSIGMEIRAQAFAFATTDEVNDMTFYNYELINRSTFELADTYFGQWVDPDLGNAQDDYVGCDVRRGLGYVYNGDDNDEDASGNLGYGINPPALGVDFFQGPFQANDGVDNCLCVGDYAGAIEDDGIVYGGQGAGYGDGIVDNERYGMRKFLYHNNAPGPVGDPNIATDYYNMLRGIWKDGTPMTYGGNGYAPSNPNAIPAGYMFPGDTDPVHWGTEGIDPGTGAWSETTAGNLPGDRRFVQSSGPFRLGPGAVNNITVGVVWQQATSGGRLASVEAMRKADDKTQALFDSCFEILDGPDAPEVTVQELNREIILMLSNAQNSNNYKEGYLATDPFLAAPDSVDTNDDGKFDVALTDEEKEAFGTYKFEGYQIYQLADGSVGTSDLDDPDKARLIAQVDIANDVDNLINYVYDSQLGQDVPELKVSGSNSGIKHAFRVTEDKFATEDNRLINHKTYYFMAIAYAVNRYGDGFGNLQYIDGVYDPASGRLEGQKEPYLASRKSPAGPVRVYEAIPHTTNMELGGVNLNAQFGDGVELKRIEGRGNGDNYVHIKEDVIDSLLTASADDRSWSVGKLTFEAGYGPVGIKVVDPLMIPQGDFTIAFRDTTKNKNYANLTWLLYGNNIDTIYAQQTVAQGNEQVIFDLGLSVTTEYGYPALSGSSTTNGYLGFEVSYSDETDNWLSGIVDQDSDPNYNWIKSGTFLTPSSTKDLTEDDHLNNFAATTDPDLNIFSFLDPEEDWENIAGRTWAPFALCSYDTAHPVPMFNGSVLGAERLLQASGLQNTPSVDVYITSDKSKWTRCPVFEAGDEDLLSDGPATRGMLRKALSVDKAGLNQMDAGVNVAEATYNNEQVIGSNLANLTSEDKAYLLGLINSTNEADLANYSFGMGWFPGYAVDAETGERLNMGFAEDSWLGEENGKDMLWNPTSNVAEDLFGELRMGGKHMIYVFRNNTENSATQEPEYLMPNYDGGTFSFQSLVDFNLSDASILINTSSAGFKKYAGVWRAGAWVGYPILAEGAELFGKSGNNDVVIKLRSTRPYTTYAAHDIQDDPSTLEVGATYYVYSGRLTTDVIVPSGDSSAVQAATVVSKGQTFVAGATSYTATSVVRLVKTVNKGLPLYTFNTNDIAPTLDPQIGVDALDDIAVVPNPYYAYSSYETGRLDYRVKIINLPEVCNINIFTVNGTLVRTYKKDNPNITSVDWNLKNQDNIPIAGGLYLIHVEVPGVGETVIKWFGVLRPIDLNSF